MRRAGVPLTPARLQALRRQYRARVARLQVDRPKLCGCGCGVRIPAFTVHAKPMRYRVGHQPNPGWPENPGRPQPPWVLRKGLANRPTRPELRVLQAITAHHLPFQYTGDGSFHVAGLYPDFVSTTLPLKVVEVFGEYWHAHAKRISATEEGRRQLFAAAGIELLVLWESHIYKHSLDELAAVIRNFGGGE